MKIAKIDADAMNSLYASEMERMGVKQAAAGDLKDRNGAPEAPQAFKDHEQYLELLTSVLKEDGSNSGDPNDPTRD